MTLRKYKVGDIYSTNCGVDAKIIQIDGLGVQRVMIEWCDEFKHKAVVKSTNLSDGKIYNPFHKSIYSIGYVGLGDFKSSENGIKTPKYIIWRSIFHRSYSDKYHLQKPSYTNCTVSSDWHCLQDFGEWTKSQKGWGIKEWQIDKDLLLKGNKEYGPKTCTMLPRRLNMAIQNERSNQGEYPIGVYKDKSRNKFVSEYTEFNGIKSSKRFLTIEEASEFYKTKKEDVVKKMALYYKQYLTNEAFNSLMEWTV